MSAGAPGAGAHNLLSAGAHNLRGSVWRAPSALNTTSTVRSSLTRVSTPSSILCPPFWPLVQEGGSEHNLRNWQTGQTKEVLWKATRLHLAVLEGERRVR